MAATRCPQAAGKEETQHQPKQTARWNCSRAGTGIRVLMRDSGQGRGGHFPVPPPYTHLGPFVRVPQPGAPRRGRARSGRRRPRGPALRADNGAAAGLCLTPVPRSRPGAGVKGFAVRRDTGSVTSRSPSEPRNRGAGEGRGWFLEAAAGVWRRTSGTLWLCLRLSARGGLREEGAAKRGRGIPAAAPGAEASEKWAFYR